MDTYISAKTIELEFEKRSQENKTTFYQRTFINKLLQDGQLKKTSSCQYVWQMIYYYILFVLMISFCANLFVLFNCIPYLCLTLTKSFSKIGTALMVGLLGCMVMYTYYWIWYSMYVYVEEWWLLSRYFDGILGDKLLWFNQDVTYSKMIAVHPEMVDDTMVGGINNISAIRGINGARNNVGIDSRLALQEIKINDASDDNNDKNEQENNDSGLAETKTENVNNDEKQKDIQVTIHDQQDTSSPLSPSSPSPVPARRKERRKKRKKGKARGNDVNDLKINSKYESPELFAREMESWNCESVCCGCCGYWVVIIIWIVYYAIDLNNVIKEYSTNDWDEQTFEDEQAFEDEVSHVLDEKIDEITDAKHYQFWAMGVLMTPVWFFVCVSINILKTLKKERKKYQRQDINGVKGVKGSINSTTEYGLLKNDYLGVTSQDEYGGSPQSPRTFPFNFGDLLNDFISSKDGLKMVILVHILLLFTWLVWHWMSSVVVKIRSKTSDESDSWKDFDIGVKRNNPLLSYWALFIFTMVMQKICQYFAAKYDKWKFGEYTTNNNDNNDSNNNNKFIDVGLELKHLVNIFMVILYSFGFRFLFTNVKEWQSFIIINVFHCIVNICNGSIQSYMKFHGVLNGIKMRMNSLINNCLSWCRCCCGCCNGDGGRNDKKQWLTLIESNQDLEQFNKDLAFELCYKFVVSTSSCLIIMPFFVIVSLGFTVDISIVVYQFIGVSLLCDCIVFMLEIYFFNQNFNDFFAMLLIEYQVSNQRYWRKELIDEIEDAKESLATEIIEKMKKQVKITPNKAKSLRIKFKNDSKYDAVFLFHASKLLMSRIVKQEKENKFLDSKGNTKKRYYGYGALLFIELVLSWLWIGTLTTMPTDASYS